MSDKYRNYPNREADENHDMKRLENASFSRATDVLQDLKWWGNGC